MNSPPGAAEPLCVEYGDNVEGTAFHALDARTWNLAPLPTCDASVLRHLQHGIPGVTTPMLYHGMLFSSFCWHVEDVYLHSVNHHHAGAPKVWYGVAARHADALEAYVKEQVRSSRQTAARQAARCRGMCVSACRARRKAV